VSEVIAAYRLILGCEPENESAGKLRSGGVGYFQVPAYAPDHSLYAAVYLEKPKWKGAAINAGKNDRDPEMQVVIEHVMFDLVDAMGCRLLEIRGDNAAGYGEFVLNRLLVQKRRQRCCARPRGAS
jgi:hypothetical protein